MEEYSVISKRKNNSIILKPKLKAMTIDKIKHYMSPVIFEHWNNVKDPERILKAKNQLEQEIQAGMRTEIKYYAELQLLKHLLS